MTKFYNRQTEKPLRRQLRSEMPKVEVLVWSRIRNRQVLNCKFRRQYSVGPYLLDFYATEIKLGIELDGESHFEDGAQDKDRERQNFIESFGIKVVRFLNTEVTEHLDVVVEVIAR